MEGEFLKNRKSEMAVLVAFGLSGMAALIYEVVWTRFLILIFGSTTYAVSTMLASFMAGLALGSWFIGKRINKIHSLYRTFAWLELGIGIYGLLFIFLLGALQSPFGFIYENFQNSFFFFTIAQFILIFLIMLIPTTMMGATFPVVSKIFVRDMDYLGKDISHVYSINSLGAVIGPVLAGFVLVPLIGLTKTNIFAAIINIGIAFLLLNKDKLKLYTILLFVPLLLIPYISPLPVYNNIFFLRSTSDIEEAKNIIQDLDVLFYKEGAYSTVTVVDYKNVTTLLIDGRAIASSGESDMRTQQMLAYIPLLLHPEASSVLNIGLGGGFTLDAIENFDNIKEIDNLEIESSVVEAAKNYLSEQNNNALNDKRAKIIVEDARSYMALTEKKYDVIISEPSPIIVSGSAQLFTKEFFELGRKRLDENGIYSQWVNLYYTTPEDFTTIIKTFSLVFPHVEVWLPHRGDAILIGSVNPREIDMEKFILQFQNQRLIQGMNKIGMTPENFFYWIILDENDVKNLADSGSGINTNDNQLIELRASRKMFSAPTGGTTSFIFNQSSRYKNLINQQNLF